MDLRKWLWSICAPLGLVLAVSNCESIAVAVPLDSFKAELARERGCLTSVVCPTDSRCEVTWEVPRFDGRYNSLASPRRGAAGRFQTCHAHLQQHVELILSANLVILCPCPRRLSSCAPHARALLGRGVPACPGAAAAEPAQTEQPAGGGTLRSALNTQPDRALSVLW